MVLARWKHLFRQWSMPVKWTRRIVLLKFVRFHRNSKSFDKQAHQRGHCRTSPRTTHCWCYLSMQYNACDFIWHQRIIHNFAGAFLQLAIVLLSNECNAAGGIAGLKELTDDMPYFGSGNRWDYFPQVADGGGNRSYYTVRLSKSLANELQAEFGWCCEWRSEHIRNFDLLVPHFFH